MNTIFLKEGNFGVIFLVVSRGSILAPKKKKGIPVSWDTFR